MKKIFAVFLAVLMLTLLLTACSRNRLAGTWILNDEDWHIEFIFSSDLNYWRVIYDIEGNIIFIEDGTYSISDNEITLQVDNLQSTFPFRIDKNILDIGGATYNHVNSNQTPPETPEPEQLPR